MKTFPGILLWAPALAFLGACVADDPVALAPDAHQPELVTAMAKGGHGKKGGDNVFEPYRWRQIRLYGAGELQELDRPPNAAAVLRFCQVNSFEDLDGNDFQSFGPGYRKEQVNEQDAFVMVFEGPPQGGESGARITHIGRATWAADFWYPSEDPDFVGWNRVGTTSQGVVFPVDYDADGLPSDPDVKQLISWFGPLPGPPGPLGILRDPDAVPGDWRNGVPVPAKPVYDLLNDPLGPVSTFPDAPPVAIVDGQMRAVQRINALLAEFHEQGRTLGVLCDADTGFGVRDGPSFFGRVNHNDILLKETWPKQLNRLFNGKK